MLINWGVERVRIVKFIETLSMLDVDNVILLGCWLTSKWACPDLLCINKKLSQIKNIGL